MSQRHAVHVEGGGTLFVRLGEKAEPDGITRETQEVHAVLDPTILAGSLRGGVRLAFDGGEVLPGLVREAHDESVRWVLFLFRLHPHPVEDPLSLLYLNLL